MLTSIDQRGGCRVLVRKSSSCESHVIPYVHTIAQVADREKG